jgi:hypothetical protein
MRSHMGRIPAIVGATSRSIRAAAALLALGAATQAALAADGVLEINADCVAVGCFAGDVPNDGTVQITASGRYRLTSNLDSVYIAFGPAALDVDLDLHGFVMDGGARCTAAPGLVPVCTSGAFSTAIVMPALAAGSYYKVRIHDGAIRGYMGSINMNSIGSGSEIDNLTVTDNPTNGPAVAVDRAEPGAVIVVSNSRFERNHADALRAGVGPNSVEFKFVVRDSVFAGNGNIGLAAWTGSVVTDSRFFDNASWGFYCVGGALAASPIGRNAFLGNRPGTPNQEYLCAVRDMGGNACLDGTCP